MRVFDPFAELDRLMQGGLSRPGVGTMPMDVFERDGEYIVRFDLPGIDPEKVELVVEDSVLTVTVEREWEDVENVNWLVRERPAGRHSRQLRLGRGLDSGAVDAAYDQGVLTVIIPMREEARPHRIQIKSDQQLALNQ